MECGCSSDCYVSHYVNTFFVDTLMKIEEIKSGKIISEQVSCEDNQSVKSTDESPKVKIEKVNTQLPVSKREFMGYDWGVWFEPINININWSAWFPKSIGVRRLLLVLAIIVYVCFVVFLFEEWGGDDPIEVFGIFFLVFLGELVAYITIFWVYRGFKKE